VIGRLTGAVIAIDRRGIAAALPDARTGDTVRVLGAGDPLPARVIAVERGRALLAPAGDGDGIRTGDTVLADAFGLAAVLGTPLLGRAIAADGTPLDGRPAPAGRRRPIAAASPRPDERDAIRRPCWTGVRAIDGPLVFGRGGRIGLFGPPGAGKSTLLEQIAAGTDADAVVVGLIGERGREAERWIRRTDARTTVICATSDRPPAERLHAADIAFAHAESLRARGLDVLLIVDSLARIAAAARDVAVAAGEPAGRGGFPASVTARQARLLERAGASAGGSVTLVATVLTEGPSDADPVADAARSILDGHLMLDSRLAAAGWYPAIDLARSVSRTFADVAGPEHRRGARLVRAAAGALDASRDARALGLDPAAGDPFLARAVAHEGRLAGFLRQGTLMRLAELADILDDGYLR
jgi:FliI/YscN family ATPase